MSHSGDECLSLVQPLADGRPIPSITPEEKGGDLDEGHTDQELVACFASERQRLLEQGLPLGVLSMCTQLSTEVVEGFGDFPRLADLP